MEKIKIEKSRFAERFKELLADKNMSQTSFGKRFGIPTKTVNNWCIGAHEPSYSTLIWLCKEFHESADYLLGLTD